MVKKILPFGALPILIFIIINIAPPDQSEGRLLLFGFISLLFGIFIFGLAWTKLSTKQSIFVGSVATSALFAKINGLAWPVVAIIILIPLVLIIITKLKKTKPKSKDNRVVVKKLVLK